jgi:hypothetical protein
MFVAVTARKIGRLDVRRILPRADEEQLTYEIVRFHLEDLNALAERTMARRRRRPDSAGSVARVAAIVQAARWHRTGFLAAIRRFVEEGRAEGVDAFGPALLLMALEAERSPALSEAPAPVRALATAFLASADVGREGRRDATKMSPAPGSRDQAATGRPK